VHFARQPGAILDEGLMEIAQTYLDSSNFHLTSAKARCAQLKMCNSSLTPRLAKLANAQCLQERFDRQGMEQLLAQSLQRQALLCYVDAAAYDETPMLTTVMGDCISGVDTQRPIVAGPIPKVLQVVRRLERQVKSEAMVAKLLQTKQTFGMLVKVGTSYAALLGETICPLQVMERTTAEVLKECILRNSGASAWANNFSFKTRAVCADKAGSNARAERSIASDRGPSWATLLAPCDIHITSAIHKHSFHSLLPTHVSGMIHCALSLRHGAAMTIFRTCLREVIRTRLKIMHGRLSASAMSYKKHIFQLFLGSGANVLVKKVLLAGLPNGDWRNMDFVEYYPPPGVNADRDKDIIAEMLSSGLCWALCEAKPSLWPRHRWCGADLSLDSIGRLEAIHGLLSATYNMFAARSSKPSGTTSTSATGAAAAGEPLPRCDLAPLADTAVEGEAMGEEREQQGEVANVAPAPLAAATLPIKGKVADGDSWAAVNAKDRALTMKWLGQRPLGHMILMRQALEPLRVLFHGQFAVASQEWEMHQRAEEARALARGMSCQRDFRMLVAAEGKLEGRLFKQLADLFMKEDLWQVIPTVDHTVGFQCTVFRLLSRIGCATEQLLSHPHKQFPYCMFKLLRHPGMAVEFSAVKQCQKDAWSKSMQEAFPTLASEDFLATLVLHAHLQWTDISGIEARHASIRRQLVARSVQTRTLDIRSASAEWVFQNIRRSGAATMTSKGAGQRCRRAPQKASHHPPQNHQCLL